MWSGLVAVLACYKPKRSAQGFTLLEILVAFVVMALVVGTLLRLYGTAMRNVAVAEEYSFAIQVAESRLQTLGVAEPVEEGSLSGEEGSTGYRWQVTMEAVELNEEEQASPLSVQAYQVTVTVSWDSAGKQRQFTLSSLRFGESL